MAVALTAQHRAGRLAFAREHQDWQIGHWRPVLFTDESRFTLSTCDRRESGDTVENDLLPATSFSTTGGVALLVLARGSLTAIRYRDEILRPLVSPYAGAVGPGFLLMQDNARPRVAGVCQQFLQDEGIEAMDWPARSPDLNPIEHIWDSMSRFIHQRHVAPQTVQELVDALLVPAPLADGCTTQDYMQADRYHDCQNGSGSSSVTSPALVSVEATNESVCGGTVVSTKMNVADGTKDCSGVVPDCHGVTQNGSGSSSVTSPALVLVETPNESVCGGTVVSTKDAAPQDAAPQDAAPQNAAPQNAAPQNAAPQNAAPQNAPPQDAPPQDRPHRTAPQDRPHRTLPHRTLPHRTLPHRTLPHRMPPPQNAASWIILVGGRFSDQQLGVQQHCCV
ncbi:hypothetical protein NFI96_001621 [Prochilodus magdalenae]|nr:hypothetical protein NFI96_001621 [Prochilodus magdalenae]